MDMKMYADSDVDRDLSLARLAEIAEAVSRQQQLPNHVFANMGAMGGAAAQGQFEAFNAALRNAQANANGNSHKRPALSGEIPLDLANKRAKIQRSDSLRKSASSSSTSTTASSSGVSDEEDTMTHKNANFNSETDNDADGNPKDVRFREYQAEIWSEKFEDLCEFRRQFGHCHVPHTFTENAPLAQWVKRQRYQFKLKTEGKRSTLSDERVRLLNQIGFIWNSHDAVWEERWNELLGYQRVHGHCIVPSNYDQNPQLAVWVKRQRRQYKFYHESKATSMTPERIVKLETLGFAWDCRKPTSCTITNNGSNRHESDGEDDDNEDAHHNNMESTLGMKMETVVANTVPILQQRSTTAPAEELPRAAAAAAADVAERQPNGIFVKSGKKTQTTAGTLDLASLPCEFFTFSRKFTKFPKIKLPLSKF